jgi:hypothetical protein
MRKEKVGDPAYPGKLVRGVKEIGEGEGEEDG